MRTGISVGTDGRKDRSRTASALYASLLPAFSYSEYMLYNILARKERNGGKKPSELSVSE